MSLLLKKLDEDLIKALKAGEKAKVTVLRGLKSDLKYKQIDKGEDLTDPDIIAVLSSCAKKRRDSIEQFESAERQDLADKESSELKIILEYLPKQMGEEELIKIISAAIESVEADSGQRMGLIMKEVMPKVKGKADGKIVKKLVSQLMSDQE